MDRERRLNLLIVVLTVAAIFAVPYVAVKTHVIAAVFNHNEVDCGDYEFDQEEWADAEDESGRGGQAEGLAKCDPIVGLSRGEVRATLGEPEPRSDRGAWIYDGGEVEGDYLYRGHPVVRVRFGDDGTVTNVDLNPQPQEGEPVD